MEAYKLGTADESTAYENVMRACLFSVPPEEFQAILDAAEKGI